MARDYTYADGQLGTSAASILAGSSILTTGDKIAISLFNTASTTETVVLSFQRAGGTARTIRRAVLAQNESVVITGLPMQPDDTLLGATTNASAVNYLIAGKSEGPLTVKVFDATGAEKKTESLTTASNLDVTGTFERAAGSVDNTHQNRVRVFEDFLADAGATLPTPWGTHDTSTAGSPTIAYVADALNGEFTLAHDSQAEAQNIALYWADQLMIDPTKNPIFEAKLKINFAGAAFTADQRIVIGLCSARNATLDSSTQNVWFRIEGANLNILWETDDNSTNDDDNDSTIDIVDNTYTTFRIDMSDLDDIKFYVDGVRCGGGTAAGAFTNSMKLQPYIEMQKDGGADTDAVTIEYVMVEWDR